MSDATKEMPPVVHPFSPQHRPVIAERECRPVATIAQCQVIQHRTFLQPDTDWPRRARLSFQAEMEGNPATIEVATQGQVRVCPWCSVMTAASSGVRNLTPARVVVARSRLGRQRSWRWVRTVGRWGTIYLTRSGGRRWR